MMLQIGFTAIYKNGEANKEIRRCTIMYWKSLLCSFFIYSRPNKHMHVSMQITPQDIDFNEDLNNILVTIGIIGYSLQRVNQRVKSCARDEDCPSELRCCDVDNTKFCCTPDNYLKLSEPKFSF